MSFHLRAAIRFVIPHSNPIGSTKMPKKHGIVYSCRAAEHSKWGSGKELQKNPSKLATITCWALGVFWGTAQCWLRADCSLRPDRFILRFSPPFFSSCSTATCYLSCATPSRITETRITLEPGGMWPLPKVSDPQSPTFIFPALGSGGFLSWKIHWLGKCCLRHTEKDIYIYVYIYMYICIYMYIYICIYWNNQSSPYKKKGWNRCSKNTEDQRCLKALPNHHHRVFPCLSKDPAHTLQSACVLCPAKMLLKMCHSPNETLQKMRGWKWRKDESRNFN